MKLTGFMVQTALAAAEEVIEQAERLKLSRNQLPGEAFHRITGQDTPGARRCRFFLAKFRLNVESGFNSTKS
jgi:hypothetical protein